MVSSISINTNCFKCTQLLGFMYCYLRPIILFNINDTPHQMTCSICSIIGLKQLLPLLIRVDLGVMVMKASCHL